MKHIKYMIRPLWAMAAAGIFLFHGYGCGKEGAPLPPLETTQFLPAPFGLSGVIDDGGQARLQWKYPDTAKERKKVKGFHVFAALVASDHCTDCPMVFTKVASVFMPRMKFTMDIQKEMKYLFKIRAFGVDEERVSEYSNTIILSRE